MIEIIYIRRKYEIITVHSHDLNEDFRAIVGHLCILSRLLSQPSPPYTTQVTPHLIVLPEYLLIPHPIVPSSLIRTWNLRASF